MKRAINFMRSSFFLACLMGAALSLVLPTMSNAEIEGTPCNPCPEPVGGCCLSNGECLPDLSIAECVATGGTYRGHGTSCIPNECLCYGDLDRTGGVGVGDLIIVLTEWGSACDGCEADLDNDGDVGVGDILQVLTSWGGCIW